MAGSVDAGLAWVDYGLGTNLSFGYEFRSYYGQALEDRLRAGDEAGFTRTTMHTAFDVVLLGLPGAYEAIEETSETGDPDPLGEIIGGYGTCLR